MTIKQQTASRKDKEDVLSLKSTGRIIDLKSVGDDFKLMQSLLKNPLTVEVATRVCQKSGTHLLKTITPRISGEQTCLYIDDPVSSERPEIFPSSDAKDSPFCKILWHPFEITGRQVRSVVDNIMNPDDISDIILGAFADVFGQDILDAIRKVLIGKTYHITELASQEFPIIFVPRPDGRDLQITPVSPMIAFNDVENSINTLYEQKETYSFDKSSFARQLISGKPQNISPVIAKSRRRLMAKMPNVLNRTESEIYNYVINDIFPRRRNSHIAECTARYADMLEQNKIFNNRNTRNALNNMANFLICDALDFIDNVLTKARNMADEHDIEFPDHPNSPGPADVLLYCCPGNLFDKVRKALTSKHFNHRVKLLA